MRRALERVGRTASSSSARRARQAHRSNRARAARFDSERLRGGAHVCRELVEDALLLGLGRQLGLAPGIGHLDRDQGLDEDGLAAARLVVHDALDATTCLRSHRHHVAPVAQGDDGLLQGARDLRVHQRLQAVAQALVGHPHGPPQPTEGRRSAVEHLAARVHARLQASPQGRQRVDGAIEGVQQGPVKVTQAIDQSSGRDDGLDHGPQLARVQAPAARGPGDDRADVMRPADAHVGLLGQQPARFLGLVLSAVDDDGVVRWGQLPGQPAGGLEGGVLGQPRGDERILEQLRRTGVHQRPDREGPAQRAAAGEAEAPGAVAPVRSGVVDAHARPADDRGSAASLRRGPPATSGRR